MNFLLLFWLYDIGKVYFCSLEYVVAYRQKYRCQHHARPERGKIRGLPLKQHPLKGIDNAGEGVQGVDCVKDI